MMSYQGVPVEEIARLARHAISRTAEVVYRRELRPVITTGLMSWTRSSSRSSAGEPLPKPPDDWSADRTRAGYPRCAEQVDLGAALALAWCPFSLDVDWR